MVNRASTTKDSYQESHLATAFFGWSRLAYILLGLFSGSMATMIYLTKASIIEVPLLGFTGYLLFQIMTVGIFILSLYSVLWAKNKGDIEQGRVTFSWWGFWIRDLFMAAVFTPFAIVFIRVLFSGAGKGLFIDLGGWEALLAPISAENPVKDRIVLGLISLVIIAVILLLAYIPLFMLWRSFLNLRIQLNYGTTTATFDAKNYSPAGILNVKISNSIKPNSAEKRRVFINCLERPQYSQAPASKQKHKRNYVYSDYQDLTVEEIEKGVSFTIPASIKQMPPTSVHKDADPIRYWEILVEAPQEMYWSRFLFLVN